MFQDEYDKTRKTLMHYATELDFLHVTKTLVRKQVELAMEGEKRQCGGIFDQSYVLIRVEDIDFICQEN